MHDLIHLFSLHCLASLLEFAQKMNFIHYLFVHINHTAFFFLSEEGEGAQFRNFKQAKEKCYQIWLDDF